MGVTKLSRCLLCHDRLLASGVVVHCPNCGEPYHRACWVKLQHECMKVNCGGRFLEDGSFPEETIVEALGIRRSSLANLCPSCGGSISYLERYCHYCGFDVNPPEAQQSFVFYPFMIGLNRFGLLKHSASVSALAITFVALLLLSVLSAIRSHGSVDGASTEGPKLNNTIELSAPKPTPKTAETLTSQSASSSSVTGTDTPTSKPSSTQNTRPTKTATAQPNSTPSIGTVVVNVPSGGELNVRSGPGMSYDRLTTLKSGTKVAVFQEENDWWMIHLGSGATGWISKKYTKPFEVARPIPVVTAYATAHPANTAKYRASVQILCGNVGGQVWFDGYVTTDGQPDNGVLVVFKSRLEPGDTPVTSPAITGPHGVFPNWPNGYYWHIVDGNTTSARPKHLEIWLTDTKGNRISDKANWDTEGANGSCNKAVINYRR